MVPVHYDSWAHFTEGRDELVTAFTAAGLAHRVDFGVRGLTPRVGFAPPGRARSTAPTPRHAVGLQRAAGDDRRPARPDLIRLLVTAPPDSVWEADHERRILPVRSHLQAAG